MLYLATASTEPVREAMRAGLLGQMIGPNAGNRVELGVPTAFDNGCFSARWSADRWWSWLLRQPRVDALFAVAPDVVADADATAARFPEWGARIRAAGFPVAFVGQDGVRSEQVPWDDLDCWFAGGSTEWKLSAAADALAVEARERGKWTHIGRVNSWRRYVAKASLYDSCDGTFLAFGPDANLPRLLAWVRRHKNEPQLWGPKEDR